MILEVEGKQFKNFRTAESAIQSNKEILEQLQKIKKAYHKFIPKENKAFGDIYHRLLLTLMKSYAVQMQREFQKSKVLLKQSRQLGAGAMQRVLVDSFKKIKILRSLFIKAAYIIGRQRGIAALKKYKLIQEQANDWFIDFDREHVFDEETGKEYLIDVPVLNMEVNPPNDVDLKRINEMIDGTEYSVGDARYTSRQIGPFLDAQQNKLANRLTSDSQFSADDIIDQELDGMDSKAQFWNDELWAVGEKAAINEWRDWQNDNKSSAEYAWAGPYDDDSCDYCLDAMDNSPYSDIDEVPEPGEGDCQCHCRHMVVLVGPGEEEE